MTIYADSFIKNFTKIFPESKAWFDTLSDETIFIDVEPLLRIINNNQVPNFEPDLPETRVNFLTASKIGELYIKKIINEDDFSPNQLYFEINKFAGQLIAPKTLLSRRIMYNLKAFRYNPEYMTKSEMQRVFEQTAVDLHISVELTRYRAIDSGIIEEKH